jgi:hypothetical protein
MTTFFRSDLVRRHHKAAVMNQYVTERELTVTMEVLLTTQEILFLDYQYLFSICSMHLHLMETEQTEKGSHIATG